MNHYSYEEIESLIIKNKLNSIEALFSFFKTDILAINTALLILGVKDDSVKNHLFSFLKDDSNLNDHFNRIIDFPIDVQKQLTPKSVKTATILFTYSHNEWASEIIEEIHNNKGYLEEVQNENIFINGIFFFLIDLNLKDENYRDQIESKLDMVDLFFIQQSLKDFYIFFKLNKFHKIDDLLIANLDKFISENYQDIIKPLNIKFFSIIKNEYVLVSIVWNDLFTELEPKVDQIKFNKIWTRFLEEMKEDLTEDIMDGLIKYSMVGKPELSLVDIGIKGIRNLLVVLSQEVKDSKEDFIKIYMQYSRSGFSTVKEWYIDNLKNQLSEVEEKSNISFKDKLPLSFYDKKYNDFISVYIKLYLDKTSYQEVSHEKMFFNLYDFLMEDRIK